MREEAMKVKEEIAKAGEKIDALTEEERKVEEELKKRMMVIPNIIDPSVPIGKDDSENVEVQKYGEPVVPDFEIPYHTQIMESFNGIDLEAAGRVAGNGLSGRIPNSGYTLSLHPVMNHVFSPSVYQSLHRTSISSISTGLPSFAKVNPAYFSGCPTYPCSRHIRGIQ